MQSSTSLPTELLEVIFKLVIEGYAPATRDRTLTELSLVCSQWSETARRLLFEGIRIQNRRHCDLVMKGLGQVRELGLEVRRLKIDFQPMRYIADETPPTNSREFHKNMVSLDQFIKLITFTPNIYSLSLRYPTFTHFSSSTVLLHRLTSLVLKIPACDINLDSLRSIIQISPNLQSLDISRISTELPLNSPLCPLIHCSPLKKLKLSVELSVIYQSNFFPSSSFVGLESFSADPSVPDDDITPTTTTLTTNALIPEVLVIGGLTLNYLHLGGASLFLSTILPTLTSLQILDTRAHAPDSDFLQQLPITLKECTTILGKDHLEHFISNPRPLLQLESITILTPSLLKLVPIGVQSVSICITATGLDVDALLNELETGGIPCSPTLRRLVLSGAHEPDWELAEYHDDIIYIFAEVGIEVSFTLEGVLILVAKAMQYLGADSLV